MELPHSSIFLEILTLIRENRKKNYLEIFTLIREKKKEKLSTTIIMKKTD
jgi:hypothetical protein